MSTPSGQKLNDFLREEGIDPLTDQECEKLQQGLECGDSSSTVDFIVKFCSAKFGGGLPSGENDSATVPITKYFDLSEEEWTPITSSKNELTWLNTANESLSIRKNEHSGTSHAQTARDLLADLKEQHGNDMASNIYCTETYCRLEFCSNVDYRIYIISDHVEVSVVVSHRRTYKALARTRALRTYLPLLIQTNKKINTSENRQNNMGNMLKKLMTSVMNQPVQ